MDSLAAHAVLEWRLKHPMSELRFARMSDDGGHLVLTDEDGHEHQVAVSDELRSAVRRPPRSAAQLPELAAPATAKDVQAMLRAGGTVQEVADRTGWATSRVERYEPPVRAERDYVTSLVRNLPEDGDSTFGEQVAKRLAGRGVDAEDLSWDSYRSATTNAWTVVCSFEAGDRPRRAQWTFEPADRRAVPIDDESRWLSEEDAPSGLIPQTRVAAPYDVIAEGGLDQSAPTQPRRPSRPSGPFARGGEATPEAAGDPGSANGPRGAGPDSAEDDAADGPVDLMSAIRRRSTTRRRKDTRPAAPAVPAPPADEQDDDTDEVDPVTGTVDLFTQVDDPTPPEQVLTAALAEDDFADDALYAGDEADDVEYEPDGEDVAFVLDDDDTVVNEPVGAEPAVDEAGDEATAPQVPGRPSQARSGRPSVPSWDDIMFGRRARD